MILHTIALITATAGLGQSSEPTPKQLIEKMLGHYYNATTLTGTIRLTVSTSQGSASMDTMLQFEKPNKIFLSQKKKTPSQESDDPSEWLVTSDGIRFSYDAPPLQSSLGSSSRGTRLVEVVTDARNKINHDYRSIYFAASKSLGDRSMPLDIAISRRDDLLYRSNQWATKQLMGTKELNGKKVYIVSGDFRDFIDAKPSGVYQMAITADGDLVQYVEQLTVGLERGQSVRITSQWDVDLKINGPVDSKLFKVVK